MDKQSDRQVSVELLALCRGAGVSSRLLDALLRQFEGVSDILEAGPEELEAVDGMSPEITMQIVNSAVLVAEAEVLFQEMADREIAITNRFEQRYPQLLFELNDPPPLLYVRGNLPDPNRKSVALIGAADATNEGLALTTKLAKQLASEGIQVVSSLHRGIDAAAHLGTITAGGNSFAVLEAGLEQLAGEDSMPLAIEIARSGGIIAEHPPEHEPTDDGFEASNRLIVGLSQAIMVTEVYAHSERVHDLMLCCKEVGKMLFVMADPEYGALSDEESLRKAGEQGAIPLKGFENIDEVIRSLV